MFFSCSSVFHVTSKLFKPSKGHYLQQRQVVVRVTQTSVSPPILYPSLNPLAPVSVANQYRIQTHTGFHEKLDCLYFTSQRMLCTFYGQWIIFLGQTVRFLLVYKYVCVCVYVSLAEITTITNIILILIVALKFVRYYASLYLLRHVGIMALFRRYMSGDCMHTHTHTHTHIQWSCS